MDADMVHVVDPQQHCPIGFKLLFLYSSVLCYRIKSPEIFEKKFNKCNENLYNNTILDHINNLMIESLANKTESAGFWTDYKTLYPGGIFVDRLDGTFYPNMTEFYLESNITDNRCLVLVKNNKKLNMKVAKCDDKYYRLCIVPTYLFNEQEMVSNSYKGESVTFYSPRPTVVSVVRGKHNECLSVNWEQAQMICHERDATLLEKGWIYINHKNLLNKFKEKVPLGVIGHDIGIFWFNRGDLAKTFPKQRLREKHGISYGYLEDTVLYMMDKYTNRSCNIYCEEQFHTQIVNFKFDIVPPSIYSNFSYLSLTHEVFSPGWHLENKLICFSDSELFLNKTKRTTRIQVENDLYKSPKNGYYWCNNLNANTNAFISESKQMLYIEDNLENYDTYAIKIKHKIYYYYFDEIDVFIEEFINLLSSYFYITETSFHEIKYCFVKRIYLDKSTVLFHCRITALSLDDWQPNIYIDNTHIDTGFEWVVIQFIKPVYYCITSMNKYIKLGDVYNNPENEMYMYKCIGDYNEGVNLIATTTDEEFSRNNELFEPDCEEDEILVLYSNPELDIQAVTEFPPEGPITVTRNEQLFDKQFEPEVESDEMPVLLSNPEQTMMDFPPEGSISVTQIEQLFDEIQTLLSDSKPNNLSFLTNLEDLGMRIDLNKSSTLMVVRDHVALVVANTVPSRPVRGLRIKAETKETFDPNSFQILKDPNITYLQTKESDAVVFLPESMAMSDGRISFVIFNDSRPFLTAPGAPQDTINSLVVSIGIEGVTDLDNNEVIDIHLKPLKYNIEKNESRSCGYWEFLDDGTGIWSQKGCVFFKASSEDLLDTCRCTHLTHFAEVLVSRIRLSPLHVKLLEYLSVIGCSLSLFGLSIVAITAITFKEWRRDFSNRIWLNLCVVIYLMIVAFFFVVFANFEEHSLPCMFTGIVLHYAVLCSFSWMLIAAAISYERLVEVFSQNGSHKLLRASAFAYITPFFVIGAVLLVNPYAYSTQLMDSNPTGTFCYPSGLTLLLSVYTPIAIVILADSMLFILILKSIFATNQIRRHGVTNDVVRRVSVSLLLVFLFGLPWVFGLFAHNLVFAYLHTLTATLQGFVLFLFFIVLNVKSRELWLKKLKIKQKRKYQVASSSKRINKTNTNASSVKPLMFSSNATRRESQ